MAVLMWHPGTGGAFEAPDDAVDQYRRSGWLRADERAEHEARMAERAGVEQKASSKSAAKAADGEGK